MAFAAVLGSLVFAVPAVAQQCGLPGNDGPGGTLTGVVNTYYPGTGNRNAGQTTIPVGAPSGSATPIANGDLLLVIQMQDAGINSNQSGAYGDGVNGDPATGWTALNNTGHYEFVQATGPVSGGSVPIRGEGAGNGLLYAYTNGNPGGAQGQKRFQVIRVPQYSSATLGAGLTALPWDGSVGGVLAVDIAGALTLASQTIDVSGQGFRGAAGRALAGENGGSNTDYRDNATKDYHGSKGEGIVGTPHYVLNQATLTMVDTGAEGLPSGSAARGAPGTAGGGGTDGDPDNNDENSGGGGGSNGGIGGTGGNTWNSNIAAGGFGGAAFPAATNLIVMGGGGGAGSRNNSSGVMSSGGAGGGIVIVRAGSVSGAGTISANGASGPQPQNDGGGGGGGGGTVVVYVASGGLGGLTVNARGGAGANTDVGGSPHGPGGGGGGGYVLLSGPATIDVSGGIAGYTVSAGNAYGATGGTAGVSTTSLTAAQIQGTDPPVGCVPLLTVTKTTSTPTVAGGPSGSTATYTITISNAAGRTTATQVSVLDSLPSGFTYASTGSVTLSGGATRPSTTNPTVGDAVPTWSTFTLPGGGQVTVTFTVNVIANTPTGTYQNAANGVYLDPARTVSNGTTTARYNYAGSAGEDVTIQAADLTVQKRHTGNFTINAQGTYTIAVRNAGNAASSGTITVRDTLPAGLTYASTSGAGWSFSQIGQVVTATRAAALAAGDSAVFTLTVNVLPAAYPSVTNGATVSGGNEGYTANDSATDPTTVNGLPDATVDKRHTAAFVVGQNGTYTLVVRNVGTATTGAVTVVDTLPAGLSYVGGAGGGWGFVQNGQEITATHAGAIAAGDSATFTLTVVVGAAAFPSVTNAATASTAGDLDPNNNRDTDPTAITGVADVTVDKRHTSAFVVGQNGIYTLVVRNVGTATTGSVAVVDTLPAGLSYVGGAGGGWGFVQNGQEITATHAGAIAAGDSATFTLTVVVGAAAFPSVTNAATASTAGDLDPNNNRDTDPTAITGVADVTVDKRHTAAFVVGQNGIYTLVVRNIGTAATGSVAVVDTLPAGLSYVGGAGGGWGFVQNGQEITATHAGAIVAGDSATFTLTVVVGAAAFPSVTNAATASTVGDLDPNNNRDTDPTAITGVPDVTVDKRHTSAFTVGQNGTYTLVVRNIGTAATGSVAVVDTLPAGLSYVGGAGGGWGFVQNGQSITATHAGAIVAGDSATFTLTVVVGVAAFPSVTNAATASTAGDLDPNNNRDTDPTAITGVPDVTVDKRHTSAFTVGQNGTYTLVVRNVGTAATGSVAVVDTLPAGLTYVGGAGGGWGFAQSGQIITATHAGAIVAGDSATFTLTVAVGVAAYPSVTNAATASTAGDLDPNNNRDTDPTAITGVPDVTVDKRHTAAFVVGQNGIYTLVVRNIGTAATGAVAVVDTLPAGLTYVGGAGGGWGFAQSGQSITATHAGAIAAGDSATFTLTVAVGVTAYPSVTNAATASTVGDLDPNNNRDTDPTAITGVPDVTVDKRHTSAFVVGQNGTYTLVVRNIGTAATGAVAVVDTLPAGLSYVGGAGGGWGFAQSGQIITATHAGAIVAGDSATFTLTVAVGVTAYPSVTNAATASTAGDLDPNNNRDTDPTAITGVPDVTVDKRHTSAFVVGQNGIYTLVVRNIGTAATGAVAVVDTLPAGLSYVGGAGGGWGFAQSGQIITATHAGAIAAGDSATFTLTVAVGVAAYPSVTNAATASTAGDLDPNNNRDTDPTAIVGAPDLTLDKRHTAAFLVGQNGTYTFVVTNVGNIPTANTITATDTLPVGLTYVGGAGAGWIVGGIGQEVTATFAGAIASGDSAIFTVTVAVDVAAYPGVTNSATVAMAGDADPNNDADTDPTAVLGVADVTLDKRHTSAFTVGQNGTYTFVVTNAGNIATASTITVTDTLPVGLTYVGGAGAGWSIGAIGQEVTATFAGAVAVGDSASFSVTVALGPSAYPGVTNSATAAMAGDVDANNDADSDPTAVVGAPDVTVDKRHTSAFVAGQNGTYTFVVTNVGIGASTSTITVTDTLPAGLTHVADAGAGWSISTIGQEVTATFAGAIPEGDSASFTVTVAVDPSAYPSVTNSATVAMASDLNANNDADSDPTAVVGVPDVTVDKRHTSAFTVGQNGTYTFVVTNVGLTATASTITVTDTLPAGLTHVGDAGAGWSMGVNGQEITATYAGSIPAGDSASFTLTVAVDPTAYPAVTNSATVAMAGDVDASNDADSDPTAVVGAPDVTVDKRHTSAFVVGQVGTYTFVVTNAGTAATTNSITVTDTLPAGLAHVSNAGAGWSMGVSGQEITATFVGSIAAGDSASFTVDVAVDPSAYPSVTNSATVAMAGDLDPSNDGDTDPTPISGLHDLMVDKRHTSTLVVGQNVMYTFVVANIGSAPTTSSTAVIDTLPAGLSYVGWAGAGWSVGTIGQEVTATYAGAIAAGDSATFTLTVAVAPSAFPSVMNSATVWTAGDLDPNDNADADPASVQGGTDVALDKRHTSMFEVGQNGTYTFVVTNVGPIATTGSVTVTDTLPAGLTHVTDGGAGWSINTVGQEVTATFPGTIAAGDSASFTVTVAVGLAAYPVVTNSATVAMAGDLDANNDRDDDLTVIGGSPDVTLDKRHDGTFFVGQDTSYTFVIRNVGNIPTGAVSVKDTLPTGLAFSSLVGTGWSYTLAGQLIDAQFIGSIAPGDSSTFRIRVHVNQAAYPAVTNSATATTALDADTSNDRDSDPTVVAGIPDLTLDKRHTLPFNVGQNGQYAFTVRNIGTAPTSGTVTIQDTLPAGLTFVAGSGAGWTFSNTGQIVTITRGGSIGIGFSFALTMTVAVSPAAYPTVTNTAVVSVAGDGNASNDRDVDPTIVNGAANLSIDKRHVAPFVVGQQGLYTLVVTNAGPMATTTTTTVTDTLPPGLTYASASAPGWNVTVNAPIVTATYAGAIAASDSASFTLTVNVGAPAYPLATNTAVVSVAGDPNAADDRDVDATTILDAPDLVLDKRHGSTFTVGQLGTYTFVVTNVGGSVTTGTVTVVDTLPAGLTYALSSGAWTVNAVGQIVTATYAGVIAPSDSSKFTVAVDVDASAVPSVTNSAEVSGGGDATAANNRDVDPTAVLGLPDLTLDKRHTSSFIVGQNGTYTLVVHNEGSGSTVGTVTVTDTLPSGLGYFSGAGAGWSFSNSGQVVTATYGGAIPAGDSSSFTLTVSVGAAALPSVTNAAEVSGGGDPTPANGRDSDPTAIQGLPDLTIDKRHVAVFTVGQNGIYQMVVTNVGAGPTLSTITVRDTLPSGLGSPVGAGAGWSFSTAGSIVTATYPGTIPAGDSASFTLTVSVSAAAMPTVTNSAEVSGGGDTGPAINRDVDVTTIGGEPDLAMDKRGVGTFAVGTPGSYVLKVTNVGTAATSGAVTVRDTLPAGLGYLSATGTGWSFGVSGQIVVATHAASIAVGDSARFTLVVDVMPQALPFVMNSATVAGGGDLSLANDSDLEGVAVLGQGALMVQKVASSQEVEIGDDVDYTITVENVGEAPVDAVEIADTLPAGLRYVFGSARANDASAPDPAGAPGPGLRFSVGTIGVGMTLRISYRVQVGAGAELGTGENTAVATGLNSGAVTIASNTAAARIRVHAGALADEAIIFGKVYMDCDCDSSGTQGSEELGIPGVRVLLEDGSAAITDAEGKYHFNHVRPLMHVVRVDDSTLPPGARMIALSNRNGRDGLSQFVDLKKGELHRVDFAERSGADSVIAAVKARRMLGEPDGALSELGGSGASAATGLPFVRSLLAVGLLNGRIDLRSLRDASLGGQRRDRFEDDVRDMLVSKEDGRLEGSARAALFARGWVADSVLMTVAFDSEREAVRRMFSDIRPNEGYDLVGDASVHEFATQSAGRLYARIERNRSYAMYGDFATPGAPSRLLSAFSRRLNGGVAALESDEGRLDMFASEGHQHQVIDEIPGQGISGPYALSRPDGTLGSERVEIVVRDRNQPTRILSLTPKARFADYTLEPFTGRLLFKQPVPSVDEDLNPISIRVTYESESGGTPFMVFGAGGRIQPHPGVSAGASISRDQDPFSPRDVVGLEATLALDERASLTAEAARSDSGGDILAGTKVGKAGRVEGRLALGKVFGSVHALRTDATFDNPSSGTGPGREELGFDAQADVIGRVALFANGIRSRDLVTLGRRKGIEVGLSDSLGFGLSAEAAYRWAEETPTPASAATTGATPNETSSLRGKLTAALPTRWRSSVFGELEQDIELADQHRMALGGDVQLTPKTRMFARHENITSFAGPFALNTDQQQATTVFGLSSQEMREGNVFTEYRLRDAMAGREAQAAIGLRNRWTLSEGVRLDGSFERVTILRGGTGSVTSATSGLEVTRNPLWKGTARLEVRRQQGIDRWLASGGGSLKLTRDWAALGRTEWLMVPGNDQVDSRSQVGLAFRETELNRLSGLARFENRHERFGGFDPSRKVTNIVSTHANWQPIERLTLFGQAAGRWMNDLHDGLTSSTRAGVVSGRTLYDLTPWLDAGVTGRTRFAGSRTYGAGAELGVLAMRNLRVAGGYNVFGFRDDDIIGSDHTDRGPYLDIGIKFGRASGDATRGGSDGGPR